MAKISGRVNKVEKDLFEKQDVELLLILFIVSVSKLYAKSLMFEPLNYSYTYLEETVTL